ncbi:UDP-N-acetylglucosamine 2-epimerase [Candidatus Sororendozoicomonas aggregata]|uniref:UDP-N-acetylglucosamine 2-epimerase n=1 Tax=Candidatus Sororendozoicomonas aggregata TaxID=3073239 RepID=UPI002ED5D234
MKKLLFLTGTRADFGKLKPLMKAVELSSDFECHIFVTGMHTLNLYGYTAKEVFKENFHNVHTFMNQHLGDPMEMILASTIQGLSRYIHECQPHMLVIHGDRVEALAGAIVGALTNTLVCHIEGGERSGTIDESIRHSVSKLSHLHMVANQEAAERLIQMGERNCNIFIIGSPDIDIMASSNLPSLDQAKKRYDIDYSEYGIVLYHSVTTDVENIAQYSRQLIQALVESNKDYIIIYPNNDKGSSDIIKSYESIKSNKKFKVFPSIRFEFFLTLLKNASFIIGNSSAGIREAPYYGVPTINIGNRQQGRAVIKSIFKSSNDKDVILDKIYSAVSIGKLPCNNYFGEGNSTDKFISVIKQSNLWKTKKQKLFNDIPLGA